MDEASPIIATPAGGTRAWVNDAVGRLARELARSADTHLLHLEFPGFPGIRFYFKDEAAHPTGSLKHRLARSLFLYALCNGRLHPGQAAVDASSGSTAISEAWFARLLGVPFIAVLPACTGPGKLREIRALGAQCDLVEDAAGAQARASAATLIEDVLGRRYGGSSGTNLVACLRLAEAMRRRGERGSIVSLLCDRGERYAETLFDPAWRTARGLDVARWTRALRATLSSGRLHPVPAVA